MKKLLSIILSMALLLTAASAALADPFTTEDGGITIEVPEGMTAVQEPNEAGYLVNITVDDNAVLQYVCYVAYSEEMAGKALEDLTEEESAQLLAGLTEGMAAPISSLAEHEGVTVLIVENGETTMVHLVVLFDGWLCDVAMAKHDGVELTEDEINQGMDMLKSIQIGSEE